MKICEICGLKGCLVAASPRWETFPADLDEDCDVDAFDLYTDSLGETGITFEVFVQYFG